MSKNFRSFKKNLSVNQFALLIVNEIETCGVPKVEIAKQAGISKPTLFTFIKMANEKNDNFSIKVLKKLCVYFQIRFRIWVQ